MFGASRTDPFLNVAEWPLSAGWTLHFASSPTRRRASTLSRASKCHLFGAGKAGNAKAPNISRPIAVTFVTACTSVTSRSALKEDIANLPALAGRYSSPA
jgi:hypothetical protein